MNVGSSNCLTPNRWQAILPEPMVTLTFMCASLRLSESVTWRTVVNLRGWLTHIYLSKLAYNRFRKWTVACSVPSHYLDQYFFWSIRRLLINFNRALIEIEANECENVFSILGAILFRPHCNKESPCLWLPVGALCVLLTPWGDKAAQTSRGPFCQHIYIC